VIRRPCPRPVRTAARRAACLIAGAGIVLASGTGPVAAAPAAIPLPPPGDPTTGGSTGTVAGSISVNGDTSIQYNAASVANHVTVSRPTIDTLRITDIGSITIGDAPCDTVDDNPDQVDCDISEVAVAPPIHVDLGDGDDTLSAATMNAAVGVAVYGGNGNDTITGSDARDQLYGGPGSDVIHGNAGGDVIRGSTDQGEYAGYDPDDGNDQLYGGAGGDWIKGEGGNDLLDGEGGPDTLIGDTGTDTVTYDDSAHESASIGVRVDPNDAAAHDGNQVDSGDIAYPYDTVDGSTVEVIRGTNKADTITASPGAGAVVQGLGGDDTLNATAWGPPNSLPSGSRLEGWGGNDTLNGSAGTDTLTGDGGDDILNGAGSNDTIDADDGGGSDTITCGDSDTWADPDGDTVDIDGFDSFTDTSCETVHTPMSMTVADAPAVIEGSNAVFTVTLAGGAHGSQIGFHYQTMEGSAGSADYTSKSGDIHFAAGSNTATVTVPTTNDQVDEPNEVFYLSVSSLNQSATASPDLASTTIQDDADTAPLLSIAPATYTEGYAPGGGVNVPVTLSKPSGYDVEFTATTSPGTATGGASLVEGDFMTSTRVLSFIPGTTSRTVVEEVRDDRLEEPDETFTVTLSQASHASLDPGASTATVTIKDNDAQIRLGDAEADESAGTVDFPVTLDHAVDHDLTLAYATHDGTATAGADYPDTTGTVTVPKGATSTTVHVPVTDDTTIEPDETFTVSLTWADDYPNPTEGITRPTATGTIVNDDQPLAMNNTNPPTVLGISTFGRTLGVATGSWSQTPSSFSYRWQRDGRTIPGATGPTYRLAVADVGSHVRVVVTAHKNGYTSPSAASTAVRVRAAAAPALTGARPHLSGKPRVGHRLRLVGARASAWRPSGVALTYHWFRNGHLIRSAHGRKYRLHHRDRHARIKVHVIARRPGHRHGSVWSRALRIR